MRAQANSNRTQGADFEQLLVCRAAAEGMRAIKNELSFRYLRGGQIKPIRADLDFRILRRDGRIAFVDCKHFALSKFAYSQISQDQLRRALFYESFNIPAGFVVCLKEAQETRFFPASIIHRSGAGSSLKAHQGLLLGGLYDFSLRGIFAYVKGA